MKKYQVMRTSERRDANSEVPAVRSLITRHCDIAHWSALPQWADRAVRQSTAAVAVRLPRRCSGVAEQYKKKRCRKSTVIAVAETFAQVLCASRSIPGLSQYYLYEVSVLLLEYVFARNNQSYN